MAPLNVLIASVRVLANSNTKTEISTPCPKQSANQYSIHEDSITATEQSKKSNFCPRSQRILQLVLNKRTLTNNQLYSMDPKESLSFEVSWWSKNVVNMRHVFFLLESSVSESGYAVSSEARSSPERIKDWITWSWPWLLPLSYSDVSGTELHAIECTLRYLQQLSRALEAVFMVDSRSNNIILRQASNA